MPDDDDSSSRIRWIQEMPNALILSRLHRNEGDYASSTFVIYPNIRLHRNEGDSASSSCVIYPNILRHWAFLIILVAGPPARARTGRTFWSQAALCQMMMIPAVEYAGYKRCPMP